MTSQHSGGDTPADQLILGLDTFGDITIAPDGSRSSHAQVLRDVVAQAELADRLGVDAITLGEHHRDDFALSSPEIALAAIAGKTERILLGTGVTVLSSDDPVRVYERFATLDAVSSGRAEVILGRGSFTESFPLFGYRLEDYETLFSEKLELFARLRAEGPVTWSGRHRTALVEQEVYPKTEQPHGVNAWIGVGGSPQSVLRSVQIGIPMMLAIIGGDPARFLPFAELYRSTQDELGREQMPLGVHSPGHIAASDEEAREQLWPHFRANRDRIGAERGWPATTRAEFDREADAGSLYVGSPETVARRIASTVSTLGATRFDLKYANGTMPHALLMQSIELYGTEVIPRVRELLRDESA
ncbi:LLM class flavin-dependent oxidoreductase [Leucobacter luti]|uniref:Putative LLM family oxidoreductase n=1 Tax=Leucobacter luti TaxID=340320 RepID=A0A4Q7U0Y7_9MICO|nr:LLM class flavin-dependent oxidoreductase [Leucobacter luti]MBL3699045.1 LLM class flavin-dependent oxidoreductase [Leucobacter luti]RZT66547.1 putative LLM family oxidoreductase [Leucobacter luti]